MSREDVEVVRTAFVAFAERGERSMFESLAQDIVWQVRADLPDSGIYRGHDGVRRLFAMFTDVMESIWFEAEEFIDAGDQVVVPLRWGGRGKGSEIDFEERETWIYTVRDRKIVEISEYATKEQALEAVGLREGR
jgi:ketosteroid isomerase-like protein